MRRLAPGRQTNLGGRDLLIAACARSVQVVRHTRMHARERTHLQAAAGGGGARRRRRRTSPRSQATEDEDYSQTARAR